MILEETLPIIELPLKDDKDEGKAELCKRMVQKGLL